MKIPSYQLTHHPVGSLREMATISWPIMLGLLSGSLMMFVDRKFLAELSLEALNASANAGMALTALLVAPMALASITEVFAGREHGAGSTQNIASPVWQMLWLALFLSPLFCLAAYLLPPICFYKTGNEALETAYFRQTILFGPFYMAVPALIGFFTALGNTRIGLKSTVLANVVNIGLDYALIFGHYGLPAMGVAGAALATSISQVVQTLYLLAVFLSRSYRRQFATQRNAFDAPLLISQIQLGLPAGVGHISEALTHMVFFRLMIAAGEQYITAAALAQSTYNLITFLAEGLSKGVSAVSANLIGARQFSLVPKVLLSASTLHIAMTSLWLTLSLLFPEFIISLFSSEAIDAHLQNPALRASLYWALNWITVFFLFDGLCWIFMGALISAGDGRFVLWVSSFANWLFYVVPVVICLSVYGMDADYGWPLMAAASAVNLGLYMWRFYSQSWLSLSLKRT
ncbi:MAG: putative multidrug efflux protein [Chlamydiales bacterium]|jgi:MATE family multidrug resistance protein|nr:putative multidrug efflux protein [Chlamydiales bacterium]